jgi:hypothetical protein
MTETTEQREPTPSQQQAIKELQAEHGDLYYRVEDDGKVMVELGDASRVLIGPRGAVSEVGSDPTQEEVPPAEALQQISQEHDASIPIHGFMGTAVEVPLAEGETPSDFAPASEELMVREDEGDLYRVMDRADEALILEEIQGNTLATMLYSFPQQGNVVTDLSVKGVQEIIRLLNERGGAKIGIADTPPVIQETEDSWRVMVRAVDGRTGVGRWGIAEQPKVMDTKKGPLKDKFALTKALNKAERNALAKMIPEQFKQTVIAQFLGTPEAVKTLKPVDAKTAELAAPLADEEAVQLQAQIHDRYDKFKALGQPHTMRMTPAAFNHYLTVASSSHQNMRALIEHIETITAEETEKKEAAANA